jgi:flagellar hook-associated protein 3 FlgL
MEQIKKLQNEVATGKKLARASDDPVASSQIKAINNYISRVESYKANTNLAESRTAIVDSNLDQAIGRVGRAVELTQQANNDTLTDGDRANIAAEMESILEEITNIANMQDVNGNYIFSGFNVNSTPYTKEAGAFVYKGSSESYNIDIGEGVQVLYNDSGFRVFGDIRSGNGTYSIASDSANIGAGVLSSAQVTDNAIAPEDYTITMVTNGAGKLAYHITGSSSGQVIPIPPATVPADAPEYVPQESIQFNGVQTSLSGSPAVGDSFYITQSKPQSIFTTLDALITTLKSPKDSEKAKADYHQVLNEQLASLQGGHEHLVLKQTEAGNRGKLIENQIGVNEQLIFDEQGLLSNLSDADLSKSISALTQQLSILEISQQSYVKIQNTLYRLLQR